MSHLDAPGGPRDTHGLIFYALVAADAAFTVDLFVRREDAEQALADCVADVPEWVDLLSITRLDLSGPEPALAPT